MKKTKSIFVIFLIIIGILVIIVFINQGKQTVEEKISEIKYNFNRENAIETQNQNNNIQKDLITVPVDVYIITYNDEEFSSIRDKENINGVFENTNSLWLQANIKVEIKKIEKVVIDDTPNFYDLNSLFSFVINSGNYNQSRINVYFAKTLHGSNGIAFPGNIIMIADKTSVYDFRATSHEIGHVLGLRHVGPVNRLMARGVNGFDLIEQEIDIARNNAQLLFPDW